MINRSIASVVLFLASLVSTVAFAATQTVSSSQSTINVAPGGTVEVTVVYDSASPRSTTGVGVQLYYDSSKLTFTGASQIYSQGPVGAITDLNDASNGDSNASTDKRIPAGWYDLGSNWPSVAGDVVLFKATFTADASFTADTTINITGVAAVGHTFATSPISVSATPVIPTPTVDPQNIPTLNEWGIILLSLMLLLVSWLGIGDRKRH